MTGQIVGQLAQAALPIAASAVGSMFTNALSKPNYSTNQADEALRSNNQFTSDTSRQIAEQGNVDYNQRAGQDLARQTGYQQNIANMANAASNANSARTMALNNQNALNQQYMVAGDRLNQASANTQNALNQAANTVASMFR